MVPLNRVLEGPAIGGVTVVVFASLQTAGVPPKVAWVGQGRTIDLGVDTSTRVNPLGQHHGLESRARLEPGGTAIDRIYVEVELGLRVVVRVLGFTPFCVLSHRHHATAARLHTGQSGVHVVGVGCTGLNSLHRLLSDLLRFGVERTHKLKTAAVEQVQSLLGG